MMPMKIAYVCSPYSSRTGNGIRENIRKAEAAAAQLWSAGFAVICPHMNSAHFDGLVSNDQFIRGDIEIIKRCVDIVVLVDESWIDAGGCVAEVDAAEQRSIPVANNVDEAILWLNAWMKAQGPTVTTP